MHICMCMEFVLCFPPAQKLKCLCSGSHAFGVRYTCTCMLTNFQLNEHNASHFLVKDWHMCTSQFMHTGLHKCTICRVHRKLMKFCVCQPTANSELHVQLHISVCSRNHFTCTLFYSVYIYICTCVL